MRLQKFSDLWSSLSVPSIVTLNPNVTCRILDPVVQMDPEFIMLLGSTSEPGLPQATFAPVQNLSCTLKDWNNLCFRQKYSHYCRSSKYEQAIKQ